MGSRFGRKGFQTHYFYPKNSKYLKQMANTENFKWSWMHLPLTLYLLVSSDNFCKKFGPRLGPDSDPKCSTLIIFLIEFFEKVDFEKIRQQKNEKYPSEYKRSGNRPAIFFPMNVAVE